MKKMNFKVLTIGVILFSLYSCTGNNSDQQQVVVPAPTVQEQPMQTPPVDSTQAQAPAAAPAATTQAVPDAVSAFVKQYFPNATIAGVERDHDHGLEYDLYLSDGTEIDFDANNQWDNVDCHGKPVPAALVPKAIAAYVRSNYQNMAISKINREHYGYEIELANGLELNFDRSGNFMGMDD